MRALLAGMLFAGLKFHRGCSLVSCCLFLAVAGWYCCLCLYMATTFLQNFFVESPCEGCRCRRSLLRRWCWCMASFAGCCCRLLSLLLLLLHTSRLQCCFPHV